MMQVDDDICEEMRSCLIRLTHVSQLPDASGCQSLADVLDSHGPLNYEDAVDMFHCLVPQLDALLSKGRGMPSIEPEDVGVLGDGLYELRGLCRSWPVEGNGRDARLVATSPPLARAGAPAGTLGGECLPPELQGTMRLPISCTPSATYFSLAMLVRKALGLQGSLAPLAGSKLYYCLKRCLRPEPSERQLFFI